MEDTSIFPEHSAQPTEQELSEKLATCYSFWVHIRDFVIGKYPTAIAEWNFPGKKYGWSFRIKDKKRAIIYLLPRDNYFKVAFVFGRQAVDRVLESDISIEIKDALMQATQYAEGRGIRIEIKNELVIADVEKLVEIKIVH
jgi:hypothetical protein